MPRDLADELLQAKVKSRLFGGDHAPKLGRLVILERIGSGAMGAVYAAYDPRLDRRVAVKLLHAADADANARSLREARALGKLTHPNVIAIHDAGEEDDVVHIVMELATGTPLRAWIHNERTWRDVVAVMRDAARGLAAAHHAGVVHRDVKPDNIVVGDDATRLIDFGLAAEADDDDGAGTPSYMAPEVLAGEPATSASDQFSFGVTLYEALYGERPHAGATREELRRAALLAASARPGQPAHVATTGSRTDVEVDAAASTEPKHDLAAASTDPNRTVASADAATPLPAARGRATQPPAWVHAIVKRTLAPDPGKRFTSMDDVVAALSRDRRRVRTIALVATAALLVGSAGGVLAYRAGDDRGAAVDRCDGSARLATAWNAARAERVRASLGTAAWVAPAVSSLEALGRDWGMTYRRVCEATRVGGEQSDRLLELRMRCLDRALDRFAALAAALEGPLDAGARVEAPGAIAQLASPLACATLVDDAELALPANPAERTRARAAEQALDRAWTAYALGRYREARTQAIELESATAGLDAPGLRAHVAVLAATVESRIGEPAVARSRLQDALAATAKARVHALEHGVWMRMLRHELFAGSPTRVIEWERFARAAALRAGLDGAELDGILGEAHRDAGQLARAREHLARALESGDPLRRDQLAIVEMNLGSVELALGQSVLAQAAFDKALAHAKAQLGDGHPTLALYRDKLAEADRARGRIASALAHHDASVTLRTSAYGADDRSVATARFHRAETLLEAGQLARAALDLEAARAIRAKLFGGASPRLGEIDVVLGDVELARGNRTKANELYARAAKLDPRLDLATRTGAMPPPVQPFTIDRALFVAARITEQPLPRQFARDIHRAWLAARTDDPTLTIANADGWAAVDPQQSAAFYRTALAALADEPSRLRLRALRGLGKVDPGAAKQAAALAEQLPELR